MAYDLLVRNAIICDGTGAPARHGTLAVKDGKIAAVGEAGGSARREIDAGGAVLAPGFIDIHTHYDAQISWASHPAAPASSPRWRGTWSTSRRCRTTC